MSQHAENSPQEPSTKPAIPVVSFVGHSGSGKTTLVEKLIRELKDRGYRVAVIKHHYHRGLEFDTPGKDSWRFARAGADHVVLAGPDRAIHVRTFEEEPSLESILTVIQDVDLIVTEGYKHAHTLKIEVNRARAESPLISAPDNLIAVVSDRRFDVDVPQFDLDDVAALAAFIEAHVIP